jgi:DNA-binding NarL/FixJ family response regulator
MWLDLLLALALVFANALFVASEFAFARLRPTQVAELERERRIGSASLRHAAAHLDAYLAACQLGITIASIGLGVIGESAVEQLLAPLLGPEAELAGIAVGAAVAFALITLLHVVVGELAPKSVAISRTADTALRVAPAMRVFYLATKPLVDLFNGLGNLVLRPFGIPPAREVGHAPHSEGELLELLAESREHGLIDGRHAVRVAGEHGRTVGVLTLEDLLDALLDERKWGLPTMAQTRPATQSKGITDLMPARAADLKGETMTCVASPPTDEWAPLGADPMTRKRLLVVDDHPAVRAGLRELLADEADFEVVAAVDSAEDGMDVAKRVRIDVAVVDYQLGGRNGLWLSRKLKRLPDPPAVLIYSAYTDGILAAAAVVAQADSIVSKGRVGSDLCHEVRRAAAGQRHLPALPPRLAESLRRRLDNDEQAIFGMLLAGLEPGEVAETLGLSPAAVEALLCQLLRRLEGLPAAPRT